MPQFMRRISHSYFRLFLACQPGSALLAGTLLLGCFAANAGAASQPWDLTTASAQGALTLPSFEGTPENGILQTWPLTLPGYTRGCYYAADNPNSPFPGNTNRVLPWTFEGGIGGLFQEGKPPNPAVASPSRLGVLLLLELEQGGYLVLLPMAGADTLSWLAVGENGQISLHLGTFGKAPVKANEIPLLAWAKSSDLAQALSAVWKEALQSPGVKGRTDWRMNKHFPEPFQYLGWCTWEQYQRRIDADLVGRSITALEQSGLPVRWVLVDAGHEQGIVLDGATNGKLKSFVPDPAKFPQGWAPVMDRRNPDKIRWFGLWHAFLGLSGNLDPDNDLENLKGKLLALEDGSLVPSEDPGSAAAFYNTMLGSVRDYGFDFAKIDWQTTGLTHYRGQKNAAKASATNSQALETVVQQRGLGLINCMAQNPVCVFNTRLSSVTRCSIDYHRGDAVQAKSHLWQAFANSLWLGYTVWPDHDMFHSNDPACAGLMAVSKAISGGPIYLSDAPESLVEGVIRPLCLGDGELLRPLAPAAPLPDSVFTDALNSGRPYRVVAPLAHGSAAVVLYNLNVREEGHPLAAQITTDDYRNASGLLQPYQGKWEVPPEGLYLYDWEAGRGEPLKAAWKTELTGFSDCLVLLTPIRAGWSVVGRTDKYLSPAAVDNWEATARSLTLTLREGGPVTFYSKGNPVCAQAAVVALGPDLWKVDLPVGGRNVRVELHR